PFFLIRRPPRSTHSLHRRLRQMCIRDRAAAGVAAATDGAAALRAVGEGYVRFALDEPGLFEVALFAMDDMAEVDDPAAAGAGGRSPYHQLQDALARLVGEGRLAADAVEGAALTCWSGVHGYATLAALGPLRSLPRAERDAGAAAVVAALVGAVTAAPDPAERPA
ncbi:TetR-like C-terminal domain-containing protein, partial [Cellulomonas sp. 179-A 9B4 NHS]|uniref:TetR-like C-terminal domain-containing protein n=1 Tax=Cellulomonas sp. 179-A 9B4 NHS TaxID=3142379 RepID=UPI0039A0DC96